MNQIASDHLCFLFLFVCLFVCFPCYNHAAMSLFLRYRFCVQHGWDRFGEDLLLAPQSPALQGSNMALPDGISLKPATCRWKIIYIRALSLDKNWAQGKYTVAPLLKGHREPITSMDCNGD